MKVRGRDRADYIVAATLIAAAAYAGYLARHLTFFYDEWNFVFERRAWTPLTFLAPHNQHWSLVPVLIYKVLFLAVGLRSYAPYIAVTILSYLGIVAVIYLLLKPRLGAWIAAGLAAMLALLGRGADDILWAFQTGYNFAILAGLIAVYLTERGGETAFGRRRRCAIAIALLVAVMSSSIGLFFLVAVAVELGLDPSRRRELWELVPVVVIYGLWLLLFHKATVDHSTATSVASASLAPAGLHVPGGVGQLDSFVPYGIGASVAGLFGLSGFWTWPGLIAYVAIVVLLYRAGGTRRARLAGAVAGILAAFVITGIGRAQAGAAYAATPRYVHFGTVFVMLTLSAAELGNLWPRWRRLLVVILAAGALSGAYQLNLFAQARDGVMSREIAELQALSLLRGEGGINLHAVIDNDVMPQVTAGQYYAAVDALGSPVPAVSNLGALPAGDVRRIEAALFNRGPGR